MTTVTNQTHSSGRQVSLCSQLCMFNKMGQIVSVPKNEGLIIYICLVITKKFPMLHLLVQVAYFRQKGLCLPFRGK